MVIPLAHALARRSLAYGQSIAQQYSEGAMNSLILISRWDGFDTSTGEYHDPDAASTIYEDPDFPGIGGPAGVTPTIGPTTLSFGDEPEYYDSIEVYIPKHAPTLPRIDDVVLVLAGPDPQFLNRQYKVTTVIGSGRMVPSIHLRATGTAPSRASI
jgi:hypothetical protein